MVVEGDAPRDYLNRCLAFVGIEVSAALDASASLSESKGLAPRRAYRSTRRETMPFFRHAAPA